MKRFLRHLLILLGLPKSLYLCLRTLPFKDALRVPIIVSPLTKFISTSGKIRLDNQNHFGTIRMGFDGSGLSYTKRIILHIEGNITFNGNCILGGGTEISVTKDAELSFGSDVKLMGECKVISTNKITIGNGCRISWNTQIMDTDFHDIFLDGQLLNQSRPVTIGNHVWICSGVKIYKGVEIANGCVVCADSSIRHTIIRNNCIFAGMPIRILRENIEWRP